MNLPRFECREPLGTVYLCCFGVLGTLLRGGLVHLFACYSTAASISCRSLDEGVTFLDEVLAYIGLDQRVLGHRLGGWLVSKAVQTAFAWGAVRVWLHTCSLDAPAALPNYLARGFSVTRVESYHRTVSLNS